MSNHIIIYLDYIKRLKLDFVPSHEVEAHFLAIILGETDFISVTYLFVTRMIF